MPEPESVPLTDIVPALVNEGFAPSGSEQLLFTVLVPELLKVIKLKVTLLQLSVAVLPSIVIVPPFALKVGEPDIVKFPARVINPLGALNVPPEIVSAPFRSALLGRVKVPELKLVVDAITKVVYELKFAVAPETVSAALDRPLKPDNTAPAFITSVPLVLVKVPLPLNVPFSVIFPTAEPGMVGFAPKGKLQLLPTVLTPVLLKVTRLKVTLLQANVAVPPVNETVPLL